MKTSKCELIFILDRSGSMAGLESDTIGGFNSLIKKQRNEEGSAIVTTVLFDDRYELLHDRIDIKDIDKITKNEYFVRGTTALLDAMGKTIIKIKNVQKNQKKTSKANKVLFVIITDGMENASREFTGAKVKKMVSAAKEKDNWEFIFLGANIDAIASAKNYGIGAENAVNYHADSQGTELCYSAVCAAVSSMRSERALSPKWKKSVEADYSNRK